MNTLQEQPTETLHLSVQAQQELHQCMVSTIVQDQLGSGMQKDDTELIHHQI